MKKTIQPFSAVVLVLMFLNLNASAQYRTETTFRDQFNGSSFTNKLDSIQYYFSGSNNWKSANDGIDLAESICKGFLYFYGSETPIPKYPDVPNLNPYASVDSFYTHSSYPGSSRFDKLVSKTIVYRDALGDASSNVKMTLDSSGAFVNSERDTFVYSAHKITQKITQKWVSGAWVNQTKFSLNYNAAGQIVEYIFAYWKSGAWENQRQYLYSYDASGNCVLFEDNVDSSGTFVYGYRTYLTYDASNRLIELFYKENTLIGTWKNVHKFTYTYTPSGEPSVVNKF